MAGRKNNTSRASSVKTPFQLEKVERVIVYVKDAERSAHFYAKTLGIPVRVRELGWVELGTQGCVLCLHGGRKTPPNDENSKVSFKVADFDTAYQALKVREVDGLTEPFSPCATVRVASFRDPDGNIISIEG